MQRGLRAFNSQFPTISQVIQLSFIYFFALIDLMYSILVNVYSLGYYPEVLHTLYPTISSLLQNPILKMWACPEKTFFMSYLVLEFMVVRTVFGFSKLVRYNVLLIFSLLMVQGVVISYWDVLLHRPMSQFVSMADGEIGITGLNVPLAVTFFLNTFLFFLSLYTYMYFQAINGKFFTFAGMEWLTDSVALWLQIKTPTMRFGKRKKEK